MLELFKRSKNRRLYALKGVLYNYSKATIDESSTRSDAQVRRVGKVDFLIAFALIVRLQGRRRLPKVNKKNNVAYTHGIRTYMPGNSARNVLPTPTRR